MAAVRVECACYTVWCSVWDHRWNMSRETLEFLPYRYLNDSEEQSIMFPRTTYVSCEESLFRQDRAGCYRSAFKQLSFC